MANHIQGGVQFLVHRYKGVREASTSLSMPSNEVMYLTTSSLRPVWKATAKSFIMRIGSAKRSSACAAHR